MVLNAGHEHAEQRAPDVAALRPVGSRRLWLALGVPPVAWFGALNAAYFLVSWACGRGAGGEFVLHAITLAMLAVSAACTVLAWRILREVGRDGQDGMDDALSRTRFLARLGVLSGGILSLGLLIQWVAILVLHPCDPPPRERAPDALLEVQPRVVALWPGERHPVNTA